MSKFNKGDLVIENHGHIVRLIEPQEPPGYPQEVRHWLAEFVDNRMKDMQTWVNLNDVRPFTEEVYRAETERIKAAQAALDEGMKIIHEEQTNELAKM